MSNEDKKMTHKQAPDNNLPVKNDGEKKVGLVKRAVGTFSEWRERKLEELDPIYTQS